MNTISQIATAGKTTDVYSVLDPSKFHGLTFWLFDLVNVNDNHYFQSFFMYKEVAFCLDFIIRLMPTVTPPALSIQMNFQNTAYSFIFYGSSVGKVLNNNFTRKNEFKGCPRENRLEFVFTDYLNVLVLKGGDSWSGPHVMVLRSKKSNMTYEQRMQLIDLKIKDSLDFDSLKKVEVDDCSSKERLLEGLMRTKLRKCWELNELKDKDVIRRSLWLALVASGILWITLNGICWVVKQRNGTLVVHWWRAN